MQQGSVHFYFVLNIPLLLILVIILILSFSKRFKKDYDELKMRRESEEKRKNS